MFIISQYILKNFVFTSDDQLIYLSSFSMLVGVCLYAVILLYLYSTNHDMFVFFNKIILYIVGVDLLLSTFYFYNIQQSNRKQLLPTNGVFYINPNKDDKEDNESIENSSDDNDDEITDDIEDSCDEDQVETLKEENTVQEENTVIPEENTVIPEPIVYDDIRPVKKRTYTKRKPKIIDEE